MALNKSITDLHGTTLASSNFKLREGEGGIRIRGELAEHTHTHTPRNSLPYVGLTFWKVSRSLQLCSFIGYLSSHGPRRH